MNKLDSLIKNIEEEHWHYFKVQAAKERITLGSMFNKLVETYKKKSSEHAKQWQIIFSRKPLLTDSEARKMREAISDFRKEFNFEG